MKKWIAMLLVLCLSIGLMAGCGAKNEEPDAPENAGEKLTLEELKQETATLTLYTYYVDNDKDVVDYALEQMKNIFPNVTVVVENRTDADGTVLKTRAAVGELPDIFECPSAVLESFATSGDIVALDDAMAEMDMASYVHPTVLQNRANSDGKIYAFSCLAAEPLLVYYNKDVFAQHNLEAPKNFDELKNAVSVLASNGVIPMSLFAQEKWPGLQMFDLACLAGGSQGIQALETGEEKITDEAYVKAAEKLEELVSLGFIGKGAFNTNASQAFEQFNIGQAAMLVNGVWYFADAAAYGDSVGFLTYNPFADAGNEESVRYNISGGQSTPGGYAVNAKSENADLATMFMLYFNIERAKAKTILSGAVCALTEEVEPKEPRFDAYQEYADSTASVKSYSKYSWSLENADVRASLEDAVEMLLSGNYTAQQFIDTVSKEIDFAMN